MAKDLTIKALENLKPASTRREISDGHTRGLYYVLQPTGVASWAFRYRIANKSKKLTLGPCPEIDLPTARKLAVDAAKMVRDGKDPAAVKQVAKEAERAPAAPIPDLFEDVLELFLKRHAQKNTRPRSYRSTKLNLEKDFLKAWRGRRLSELTRKDVNAILDTIIDRGAPVQANRSLAGLRKMCNWAVGREIITVSPCDHLQAPTVEKKRQRFLTLEEIKLVWTAFDRDGWAFGDIAKLLTLTAQREDEVGGMLWAEVDFNERVWNLPAERSKNGYPHKIPLSDQAIGILQSLPRINHEGKPSTFVFTTTGKTAVSGYSRAKRRFDKLVFELQKKKAVEAGLDPEKVEPLPNWTYHDLRRSATTHLAAMGFQPHVVDAILNHKSGKISGVAAIYNVFEYLDERKEALEAWGKRIEELMSDAGAPIATEAAGQQQQKHALLTDHELLIIAPTMEQYQDILINCLRSGAVTETFARSIADLIDPSARTPLRLVLQRRSSGRPDQKINFDIFYGVAATIDDFAPREKISAAKILERALKLGIDLSIGGNTIDLNTVNRYRRIIADVRAVEREALKKSES